MEQRPLRLGDIVDDYCPRERRITNHAIVAIVEETVKQTRCTTCDHEHVFKQAREPRRRKKDEPAALYAQVLSGLQKNGHGEAVSDLEAGLDDVESEGIAAAESVPGEAEVPQPHVQAAVQPVHAAAAVEEHLPDESAGAADEGDADGNTGEDPGNEIWPMHRRLIRAQLPRTGNEPPPARPLPDFTIRQPGARGGGRQWGRGGAGGGQNGNSNGNHAGRGGHGGGGQRPGRGGRFAPPRPDGPRGGPGGRPGGGRGRRSR
jgi:hypothetical protein